MNVPLGNRQILPVDDNATYYKHIWIICILWTLGVISAGIVLALLAL